jgi:SSS family solute:Na+ symporter
MAILSTAISLLNAVSSNLAQDFNFVALKGPQSVQLCRGITAGIGIVAVASSFYMGEIVGLLIQSYELSVYCLLIPVCAALFRGKTHALSAWLALLMGGVGFGLSRFMVFGIPTEVFALLLSASGYGLGQIWLQWRVGSIQPQERVDQ